MLDWLKLVRVTGLVTIISNIIAAVVTAVYASEGLDLKVLLKAMYQGGTMRVVWLLTASCLLYTTGMIWNDLADVERDRVLHPRRPLPSGRIGLGSAYAVGVLLAVGALLCAAFADLKDFLAFYAAGVVLSLIFLYNFATKDLPWLGSLNMAAVRFSHALFALLLLGTDYLRMAVLSLSFPWRSGVLAYPIILGCYVLGLTLVSELESRAGRRIELLIGGGLMFGSISASCWMIIKAHWIPQLSESETALPKLGMCLSLGLGAVLALWLLRTISVPWLAALKSGSAQKVGPVVGAALGGMLLLDALVATSAHPAGGIAILLLLPFFMLGRRVVRMD
jgi:4-hydroxybenzoate polyprenyltransferase